MPVAFKFSRELLERLGEGVANEMVDWFNQVDATYRADLRQFNELNFERFDAKLEQRLAEFAATIDRRLSQLDSRWAARLAQHDAKWDRQLAELDSKWESRFTEHDGRFDTLEQRIGQLEVKVAETKSDLTKTVLLAWAGTVIPLTGLMIGMFNALR
ncbi:MAG: hypothetical protein ACE5HT_11690 [Gemmatimonadales bacterium]